jgi:hypothetical protein
MVHCTVCLQIIQAPSLLNVFWFLLFSDLLCPVSHKVSALFLPVWLLFWLFTCTQLLILLKIFEVVQVAYSSSWRIAAQPQFQLPHTRPFASAATVCSPPPFLLFPTVLASVLIFSIAKCFTPSLVTLSCLALVTPCSMQVLLL